MTVFCRQDSLGPGSSDPIPGVKSLRTLPKTTQASPVGLWRLWSFHSDLGNIASLKSCWLPSWLNVVLASEGMKQAQGGAHAALECRNHT